MVDAEVRLRIVRDAPFVNVHTRTYWDVVTKQLFVNLGGPEVYIIGGKDKIETSHNGECGYMFVTREDGRYIVPDFTEHIDCWKYLVNDISFTQSSDAPAKPEEQRELLKAWILSFFFQEIMPTKPILSLIGQAGSGKTTAIRRILRILEHPSADVLGIPTDKQDAFRSSIEKHRLLVIDNLEKSGAWWMVDMLNKLSTGNHIEVRKLYKTNETHTIIPRCYVAITAVNIPFNDETLFSRLLVLNTERLAEPLPENLLQRQIKEHGPAIWADLLRKLGEIVDIIAEDAKIKAPTKSRLVDFTVFCERIKHSSCINGESLYKGLLSMVDSQLRQLQESSQAIFLLSEWISLRPTEAAEWRTFVQLFDILQNMATARRINFPWKSAQSLYRHFNTLEDKLKQEYQAEIAVDENLNQKEGIKIRFNTMLIGGGNGKAPTEISLERVGHSKENENDH
jgi:energy-coupling factor transporter ATP-binding protein EcfA2